MRIEQKIRRAKASMFEAQQGYAMQLSLGPAQVPETLIERGNLIYGAESPYASAEQISASVNKQGVKVGYPIFGPVPGHKLHCRYHSSNHRL